MAGKHLQWPDLAKGIGIILVVFGHDWRGLKEAGILRDLDLFAAVDGAIYSFHMPLFFFLAGWFFPATLRRYGASELVSRSFWRLIYPLCLWTYLFIGMKVLAGQNANTPVGWQELLRLPIPGYLHLWFLWALALVQLVLIALRPLILRAVLPWLAGLWILSVAVYALALVPFSPLSVGAVFGMPFFLLAALWSQLGELPKGPAGLGLGLLAFVVAVGARVVFPEVPLGWKFLLSSVAVIGLLSALRGVAPHLGRLEWPLAAIGRVSMTIYLMHTIFSGAMRSVLLHLGVHDLGIHLVLGVLAGVGLPCLLYLPQVPVALRSWLGLEPGRPRLPRLGRRSASLTE